MSSSTDRSARQPAEIRAPGKLFWIGEYAVLFGHEALAAAVDRYATLEVIADANPGLTVSTTLSDARHTFALDADPGSCPPEFALVGAALRAARAAGHKVPAYSERVHIDTARMSGEGTKLGVGSSAAVAALLSRYVYEDERASPAAAPEPHAAPHPDAASAILELALDAHNLFQGRVGSGGDVVCSVRGGLNVLRKSQGANPWVRTLAPPEGLRTCVIATGVAADTRDFVRRVRAAYDRDPRVVTSIHRLGEIAAAGIHALANAELDSWLDAVGAYHREERTLTELTDVPIVSDVVEACVTLAESCGARAKASGAGGGDVVLCFAAGPSGAASIAEVHARASKRGFDVLDLAIATRGVVHPPAN